VSEMMVVAHRNGCVACYEMKEHPVALARLRNFHVPSAQKDLFIAHLLCSRLRDGVIYAAQFKSSTVRCRDLHSGRKISDMHHKKIVTCMELAIEYGKEYVITGCIDGSVRMWENGQVTRHQFEVWGEKHKGRNPVSAICVAGRLSGGGASTSSPSSGTASAMGGSVYSMTSSSSSNRLIAVATQYGVVQLWSMDFSIFISSCIGKIALNRWVTSLQFHPSLPILFALTDKGAFIPIWIGDALNQSGVSKGEAIDLYAFDMMDPLYISVDDPDVGLGASQHQSPGGLAAKYTASKYAAYCLPSVRFELDPRTYHIAFYGKSFQLTPYASITSNYQNFGCDIFPLFSVQDLNHPLSSLPICSNHSTQMDLFLGGSQSGLSSSDSLYAANGLAEFKFPFSQVYFVDTLSERPNAVLMSKMISEENLCRVQSLRATSAQQQKDGFTEYYQCVHASFSPNSTSMLIFYKLLQQKHHNMNTTDKRFANNQAKKATFSWKFFQVGKGETPLQHNGLDGTFLDDKEFIVLSEDGRSVSTYYDNQFVQSYDILGGATSSDADAHNGTAPSEVGGDTPLQSNNFSFEDLSGPDISLNAPRLKSVQITRIFASPYDSSLLLYSDELSNTLGFAHPPQRASNPGGAPRQFQYDLTLPFLHMKLNEKVLSVVWQQDRMASGISPDNTIATPIMIGILTSHRVMITTQKLEVLSQMEIVTPVNSYNNTDYAYKHKYGGNSKSIPFTYHSCLWVGNTLLFNDDRAVYALIAGRSDPIHVCSLDHDRAVLSAAFPDRLMLISQHPDGERISTRYLNMADLLIEGILGIAESKRATNTRLTSPDASFTPRLQAVPSHSFLLSDMKALDRIYAYHSEDHISLLLKRVTECFDCRQIPEWAITRLLAQGFSQICSSLLLVTVNEYQWTSQFQIALKSMRLTEAFNSLRKQFLIEYIDGEFVPENSQYFSHFSDLASKAMEHAQHNLAARCLYMIQDVWKLFSLFAKLNLTKGLVFLSNHTRNSTDLYSIHMACETLLQKYGGATDGDHIDNFERVLDNVTDEPLRSPPQPALPVATQLTGKICTKKKSVSPTELPSSGQVNELSTAMQYDEMEPLKHSTNIATWLGFTNTKRPEAEHSSSMDDASQGWGSQQTFDFQKPFEYSTDSSSRLARTDSAVSADEMSSRGAGSGTAVDIEASETESVADQSEKSNGMDTSITDQDALRQKYLGAGDDESSSSNSEFSDSDEDRGYNSFKRKKKLFKTVRISDTSVVSAEDAAPKTLNFGGTLSIGNKGPARRRRIGSVVPQSAGGAAAGENDTHHSHRRGTSSTPQIVSSGHGGKSKKSHHAEVDPLTATLTAAECLKKATEYIDAKNYPQAKRFIVPAIQKLISDPQETLKKTHILLCVKYLLFTRVALKIGESIKKKSPQEKVASVAACLFTASENLTPQHFFFCRNQCYKMNLQAGNYGFAAYVLRSFIHKTPPKYRQHLEQNLDVCKEHNFENENSRLPSKEGDVFLFDWNTFELLDGDSPCASCEYCGATYKQAPHEEEHKCHYCFYGSVQETEE